MTPVRGQELSTLGGLCCQLLIIVSIALLGIAGCSSTPSASDENSRKAAETNTSLGQAYMDRGQYEIALEKLKRAVAHDRTYAPAYTVQGLLYERIGEDEQAEQAYRNAVKYDPEGGDVNNNLGAFLCRKGSGGETDRYFETALDDPFYQTPWVAYANAGNCALQLENLDKAERYLRQSLEFNNEFAPALLSMAEISLRNGSDLRARAFLQRYEAVGTMNEESLLLGYRIESALNDTRSANRYRQALMENYPNSPEAGQLASQE